MIILEVLSAVSFLEDTIKHPFSVQNISHIRHLFLPRVFFTYIITMMASIKELSTKLPLRAWCKKSFFLHVVRLVFSSKSKTINRLRCYLLEYLQIDLNSVLIWTRNKPCKTSWGLEWSRQIELSILFPR